jgi:hypothetical protein
MSTHQVRPHIPGPGYICSACELPHRAGCIRDRDASFACPNMESSVPAPSSALTPEEADALILDVESFEEGSASLEDARAKLRTALFATPTTPRFTPELAAKLAAECDAVAERWAPVAECIAEAKVALARVGPPAKPSDDPTALYYPLLFLVGSIEQYVYENEPDSLVQERP